MRLLPVLVLIGLAVGLAVWRHRNHRRVREAAKTIAATLVPEIRAAMSACDPSGPGTDDVAIEHYGLSRQRLPRMLPEETLFAVETFYQCLDAYQASAKAMNEAFSRGSPGPGEAELSLGDKIRAKDRRDRCLKDVYYTGEAALERLSKL